MSMLAASDQIEPKTQGYSNCNCKEPGGGGGGRAAAMKCRIPQRTQPSSARRPTTSVAIPRFSDSTNQKYEEISSPNSRYGAKNSTRSRLDESRPKSAGRLKEELFPKRTTHLSTRFTKPAERVPCYQKRPLTLSRKMAENHKDGRIVVPTQGPLVKMQHNNQYCPMQQETNKNYEDLELRLSEISDGQPESSRCNDQSEGTKSTVNSNDQTMKLKIYWQSKIIKFEQMKNALKDQQKNILSLYAILRDIHHKLSMLGEEAYLPPPEDLQIMNVANLTPDQLLQLCADDVIALPDNHQWDGKTPLAIDMDKFYMMPTKLIHTCEQTLVKRKEIIDWFESLTKNEKKISVDTLLKKVNEFNAENDMLKCSLDLAKSEFLKELDKIVDLMRKGVRKTMALHLRTEELTYQLSDLNSQNMDLRKQIHNADHTKFHTNRARVVELERELKDEKCKRLFLKDRLSRSDGQVKINIERASQLEASLEQAQSQIWSLERTVQQLNEQNQKLQNDFDKELNKLTESIREHTVHLEQIADAREKLQLEKEDLEKRLVELSDYYNESLENITQEMNINIGKLNDIEKKYEEQGEDKTRLEKRLELLCSQIHETDLLHKDTLQQLHEMEVQHEKDKEVHKELENTKKELDKAKSDITRNEERLSKQSEAINNFERSLKEAVDSMEALKSELSRKDEYITEMEKKQALREQQLQEKENKMEVYVEQLSSLKTHINELQEDFGDFENLSDLHEMVNEQRSKLLEATRQNGELAEALQKKDKELIEYIESLSEHEKLLLEREDVIKMLSEKEEEQTNIIKILRNNLELRSQADLELSQHIMEKNIEIDSLVVNLETRKQQISNLEKIILTLEDQTRKASQTRKRDQDCISRLQTKLAEYESFHMEATRNADAPAENLDSFIKILEDELETSFDSELKPKNHNYNIESKKKFIGERNCDKFKVPDDTSPKPRFNNDPGALSAKFITGNLTKKTHNAGSGEQYSGDNLDRKKGITNIDTQKWVAATEPRLAQLSTKNDMPNRHIVPCPPQNSIFNRNLRHLSPDQQKEDRKYKMFKLAGHRL